MCLRVRKGLKVSHSPHEAGQPPHLMSQTKEPLLTFPSSLFFVLNPLPNILHCLKICVLPASWLTTPCSDPHGWGSSLPGVLAGPLLPPTGHSVDGKWGTFFSPKLWLLGYITSYFFNLKKHPLTKLLSIAHKELQLASSGDIGTVQETFVQ